MGPLCLENVEIDVLKPLEEGAQVVAVGLEGSTAVAGQVRSRRHLGLSERIAVASVYQRETELGIGVGMTVEEDSEHLCGLHCPGRP